MLIYQHRSVGKMCRSPGRIILQARFRIKILTQSRFQSASFQLASFSQSGIASVTIPNTVTTIGDYAFNANNLTDLDMPDSVVSLEHRRSRQTRLVANYFIESHDYSHASLYKQ